MSDAIQLSAVLRKGSVDTIKDFIPAVVYGAGIEATSLTLKRPDFEKVFSRSGESGLVTLKLDDNREMPVLVKDLQYDALKHRIIHVDFYKLNMDEKVVAEVTIEFVGESPAVKSSGGIVVEHMDQLEIEALPMDLIQKIEVDLSRLINIGDSLYVKDIILPKGVEAKSDQEEIVVHVIEPNKVVEEAPVVAEAAAPAADAKPEEAKVEEKK